MIGLLSAALLSSVPLLIPDQLPAYPGTALTQIGEELIVDRMPQRLAYFVTRDSLEAVSLYFLRQWRSQGYLTTADGDSRHAMVVSAFCTREAIQKAVVLRAQGGRTIGFSVLRSLRAGSAPLRPPLEGQLFVHDAGASNQAREHSHRTLLLNAGLTQARQQVIERLLTSGCLVVEGAISSIDLRCPDGRVRLVLIAQSPELTAVLEMKQDEISNGREQKW